MTCSALSELLSEPLPGTAAVTGAWLCVEQPGPWGRKALLHSRFDPAVAAELAERADGSGVRVQLIRRPGHRAAEPSTRRVYLAFTDPACCWLREAAVDNPADLLELDFAAIAQGVHGGWGQPSDGPLLLVCTNGRRDQCCAVWGRPLASELAAHHGDSVWETSHTGGHRFAPNAVLLPSGYTYGRLKPVECDAILSAARDGNVVLEQCRGRSTWPRPAQAAEIAVRDLTGERATNALRAEEAAPGLIRITHTDGHAWSVSVREQTLDPPRPNGCGNEPIDMPTTVVGTITPLGATRPVHNPSLG
jgi:hypothetical protein